jgi:hypothetical protein
MIVPFREFCQSPLPITKLRSFLFQRTRAKRRTIVMVFKGANVEYKYNEEVISDKELLVLYCIYSVDTVDAFEE